MATIWEDDFESGNALSVSYASICAPDAKVMA
jgi:hypothetical protein